MTQIAEVRLTFDNGVSVLISWQRGDDYRALRLYRVADFLNRNGGLPPELFRLHDHAGILRPCWSRKPRSGRLLRLIFDAWTNEGETQVWHMLGDDPRGAPFLEDEDGSAIKASPFADVRVMGTAIPSRSSPFADAS